MLHDKLIKSYNKLNNNNNNKTNLNNNNNNDIKRP